MPDDKKIVSGKYLEYKGKPLVREGDTICYGDKSEKCFLILEIMTYKKMADGTEIPDKIFVQVLDSSDPTKIIAQNKKEGLSEAFSWGLLRLEMELKKA